MMSRALLFLIVGCVLGAAALPVTAKTSAAPKVAEAEGTLPFQGAARRFVLVAPHPAKGPVPLVVALHETGQTIAAFRRSLHFDAIAEREGIAVVYPEAIDLRWSYGRAIWQPMPTVNGEPADDLGFVTALIDWLVADGIADPTRIYVTGSSRGGLMTYTLACAIPDRLAAAAPLISGMTDLQIEDCRPSREVPLIVLNGNAGFSHSYDGWISDNGRLTSVPETLEFWRRRRGCRDQTYRYLPDRDPKDETRIAVLDYVKCESPAMLRLYRVENGGHTLPSFAPIEKPPADPSWRRSRDMETAEELWAIFRTLSLPSGNG